MDQTKLENPIVLWDVTEGGKDASLDSALHICARGNPSQGTEDRAFDGGNSANFERLTFRENPDF